ncbi:hypothetical protein C7Y70_19035 [Pseudoalteromonas sp. KS88]|uniref:hypothetical protein n=1 Tax=Pseudoalteromonas sp. KS88 TaxID=2109918 RepID=UPI001081BEC3|nr:hypothetical protein [Pseudoalteromonas sp. KS88]TGE76658.1 hypothetical protein C7Y70_19035 [Pseudoalteromonas sp. KS88]
MKLKLTVKNNLIQSGMKASLSKLVKSNLGKYALHIRKVDIRVDDVSTQQHGTLQECSINMLLPGLPSVVVKRKGKNILHAIQRALTSLQDVLMHKYKVRG